MYDKYNPESIESYAKKLIGKTFKDVIGDKAVKGKGGLGVLLEEHYFGYKPNSDKEPDFKEAGVELKSTPYKRNKNGTYSAKERLVLNIINYMEDYKDNFEESSFYNKNKLILLIYYFFEKELDKLDYPINYVQLFEFPEVDLEIIKKDWETIVNKIKAGKAHEISEADTIYLSACTKGANKESVREQPFSSIVAKQRAFSLKPSYMTYILRDYFMKGKPTYEPKKDKFLAAEYLEDGYSVYDSLIIKNINELKEGRFEEIIKDRISKYKGTSLRELGEIFNVNIKSKAATFNIARGMLGVTGDKIKEFEKANIKIKAIRISKNNKIKESMSFPTFKYIDIINEEWEESKLRNIFIETKYLFVIFKENNNGEYCIFDSMFWNMPINDLDVDLKWVWEETVMRIKLNKYDKLPGSKENRVGHVRPHATNGSDTYPTPDGKSCVKKCFWLNNTYILSEIKKEINIE